MKEIFEFLRIAEKLKYEKRDNKLSNGDYEDVAGHSWMMGLFALLFHDKMETKVDIGRALKIIIVHDLAEALCGDVGIAAQCDGRVADDKKCRELAAIKKIVDILPPDKGAEILELWEEFENFSTPEGKFAKACDKLEANTQAIMFGSVKYWDDYEPKGFYYDDWVNNRRRRYFEYEPAFNEFYETIKNIGIQYMKADGIDPDKYLEKNAD